MFTTNVDIEATKADHENEAVTSGKNFKLFMQSAAVFLITAVILILSRARAANTPTTVVEKPNLHSLSSHNEKTALHVSSVSVKVLSVRAVNVFKANWLPVTIASVVLLVASVAAFMLLAPARPADSTEDVIQPQVFVEDDTDRNLSSESFNVLSVVGGIVFLLVAFKVLALCFTSVRLSAPSVQLCRDQMHVVFYALQNNQIKLPEDDLHKPSITKSVPLGKNDTEEMFLDSTLQYTIKDLILIRRKKLNQFKIAIWRENDVPLYDKTKTFGTDDLKELEWYDPIDKALVADKETRVALLATLEDIMADKMH